MPLRPPQHLAEKHEQRRDGRHQDRGLHQIEHGRFGPTVCSGDRHRCGRGGRSSIARRGEAMAERRRAGRKTHNCCRQPAAAGPLQFQQLECAIAAGHDQRRAVAY